MVESNRFGTLMQHFVLPQLAEAFVFPERVRVFHLAGQRALFPCQQASYEASLTKSHCGAGSCCNDGGTRQLDRGYQGEPTMMMTSKPFVFWVELVQIWIATR